MSINAVNSLNSITFKGKAATKNNEQTKPQETKKDGKKKLALTLAALAATGAAIAIGAAILKGKDTKLVDIDFNKGQALLPTGEKFSGTIKDKLPNGDNIKLVYQDGILQQSTRKGAVNFIKNYEYTSQFAQIPEKLLEKNTITDRVINNTNVFDSKVNITESDLNGNIIKTSELKFTNKNGKVKLFSFEDSNGKSYVHIGDTINQLEKDGVVLKNDLLVNKDGSKYNGNIISYRDDTGTLIHECEKGEIVNIKVTNPDEKIVI